MIDIRDAVEQSKNMPNISDGGSACYDFSDVVLVKYTIPLEYLKDGNRARDCEEMVMNAINKKVLEGVNTPRHIAVFRVVEGDNDVCYVLQEKCKGKNCGSMSIYGASYERVIDDLNFVNNIPFEHYKKLISDGCMLAEMGYEHKNKNLFYDEETGFWYIDFLTYDKDAVFDKDNLMSVFKSIKYVIPNPIQIASKLNYSEELLPDKKAKKELLEYSIEAKNLLAIKSVIPNFERYEKFYLINKTPEFRQYLMDEEIVKKDLFDFTDSDYPVYDELFDLVVDGIVFKIINNGLEFWSVEMNDIRNDSALFGLDKMWLMHKDNSVNRSDYEDEYDYEDALRDSFKERMLKAIVKKLEGLEKNESSVKFLDEMSLKYGSHVKR